MRKKSIFIIFLIVLNFLFVKSIFSNVQAASNKLGDVNNNGKIDSADYVLVRSHIIGTKKLTSDQITRADTNSDSKINSADYVKIRQAIINKTEIKPTATATPTAKPTQTATPTASKANLEAYFLNSYNRTGFSETFNGNNAFIFKTSNGKYVLIDTGNKSEDIRKAIYSDLKSMQNKSTVTIDYMIISHMHSDHYGNVIELMESSKFKIKNLILKREKASSSDEGLVKIAKNKGINIIETDTKFKEGSYYTLSNEVKMYFFNVKDIYYEDNCEYEDYSTSFTSSITAERYAKTKDGKYIYFEGKDYLKNGNNAKIYTTPTLEQKLGTDYKINGRFYLTFIRSGDKRSRCSSNGNCLAILFQVKTDKGNKYMYIPSDLENDGYSSLGEYDSTYKTTIHGYGPTYFYEYEIVDGEPRFIVKNNKLVQSTKTKVVKEPSAYKTALNMKKKFSDLIGNITVYQMPHHGLNTYSEVVGDNLLKLNSSSVYAVTPSGGNPKNNKSFSVANSVYLMRNAKILFGGGTNKNGVKCTIDTKGTTTCGNY